MKISFVIASLQGGGAERVAVMLANEWAAMGHSVSILTFEKPASVPAYRISSAVKYVPLSLAEESSGIFGAATRNLNRIRLLRKSLTSTRPDVVVSFMSETNVLVLVAGIGAEWPTIVSERIHPAFHPVAKVWMLLRRLMYSQAAVVVVQANDIADWVSKNIGVSPVVIRNPVDLQIFSKKSSPGKSQTARRTLLAAGRLSRQKGYDVLIDGFAEAASRISYWDLYIYGDGPDEGQLRQQIANHGLNDRIFVMKYAKDIAEAYQSADAFVHSARYEGYPNVVVEALASGLPVIAANSGESIQNLLGNGKYGVLYTPESPLALSRVLIETLDDGERLVELARRAPEAVLANSIHSVAPLWIDLFRQAIASREARRAIP